MRTFGLSLAALVAAALGGFVIFWRIFTGYLVAPASTAVKEPTVVVVPANVKVDALGQLLAQAGVVSRPEWFVTYLEHFRRATPLKPGEYALSPNMSPAEIVDRLSRGAVVTYNVTIPPCATTRDVARQLGEASLASEAAIHKLLEDPTAAGRLDVPGESFEGYLFPDVYSFSKGMEPEHLLRTMVQRYRRAVTAEILDAGRKHDLVEHQLITLASMIEAAPVPEREWGQLSAVFHNRLKDGMPLEDGATLAFALGKKVETLTREDEESASPFNTFERLGLPPTPICNPSLAAITAAAGPMDSDARYYASRGDGAHVFCPDEECHRLALERAGLTPREKKKPKRKKQQ